MAMKKLMTAAVFVLAVAAAASAQAQVRITEVTPWGSGNAPYASDWFELTNIGSTAINIANWRMDDNSNSFASSVALTGITNIAAGESVIFLESAVNASFLSTWFGANAPAGLQVGNYTGAGVGLGTGGDAVNIYNGSGILQANVTFGTADAVSPFQTFDNTALANNAAISLLSISGINGAFAAANNAGEIGSPGTVAAVPEPETYALMLGGLMLIAAFARKRA